MPTKEIYLDYAAATPIDPRVLEAMQPYFSEKFYNPSASYLPAKRVREAYEAKKAILANSIGAKLNDLIITAGATESINLAFTTLRNYPDSHCLILQTEHAAVHESAKAISQGCYDEILVEPSGLVNLNDLKSKIKENTVLISIALANNELGVIQPLSEISKIIQTVREDRLKRKNLTPLYLHSDASQAMNLIDLSVSRLGVDLLTLNAAKIYGPKGIGALYLARGIKLLPIVFGGGQEMGLRSGTENVASLVGFAEAAVLAKHHLAANRKKYQELARLFRQNLEVDAKISPYWLGNPKHQLSNFAPVSFPGLDAERLIFKLEDLGIYLSTGAACAASKGQKSRTYAALGLSDSEINGSLRITFGKDNQPADIMLAAKTIARIVNQEAERLKLI